MPIVLRQICLLSDRLEPAVAQLCGVLNLAQCFEDPAVGQFGLKNAMMPVGSQFLEIVAPIREGTPAGRYLDRRGGPGGYIVICQATTRAEQEAVRARSKEMNVRTALEYDQHGYSLMQLHPADTGGAFLEVDYDAAEEPEGHWEPAGGRDWTGFVKDGAPTRIAAAELQSPDPRAMAQQWAHLLGLEVLMDPHHTPWIELANASLHFVPDTDGRGPGLGGIALDIHDAAPVLSRADAAGVPHKDGALMMGGMRIALQ